MVDSPHQQKKKTHNIGDNIPRKLTSVQVEGFTLRGVFEQSCRSWTSSTVGIYRYLNGACVSNESNLSDQ